MRTIRCPDLLVEEFIMKRLGVLSIILSAMLLPIPVVEAQQASSEDAIKALLIGSWRLVQFDAIGEDGETVRRPYSTGRIDYQATGLMNAQLMPEDWGDSNGVGSAGAGYIAYFGTFSVDLERQAVIHHVEGAYNRNMLGQSMSRYYEFSDDGNTLFLEVRNNGRTNARLRWARVVED
ncbi:MAG: lipocalin-like domain-containing protein [Gammaproteobacteria bacterium]|nr:lipocalin-like domain-containing protein [Gammaproteobacteria bacterium]MYE29320.1 lipocalin-like domain-containing protein [Gammaproteobacteria bacterium]